MRMYQGLNYLTDFEHFLWFGALENFIDDDDDNDDDGDVEMNRVWGLLEGI